MNTREKIDHLIHAKWIIPCEEASQHQLLQPESVLEEHSLAIKNGIIVAVKPTNEALQSYDAAEQHHYPHHAITPGLINSHSHSAMNMFRGLADDLELMDWLNNHIWPAEGKWVSHDFVRDASKLAIAEMIRCGTTCFNDMYFFLDATADVAIEAKIRAHIGMTVIDVPTAYAKTTDEYFEKGIAFIEKYKNNSLVTPTLAPHSTYTVSLANLMRVKDIADKYKLKTNIHLQEAPSEVQQSIDNFQKRPLQRLNDIGMVNSDLIAVHMTQISDEDFAILEQKKPSLVHCPESNLKLVSGMCPIEKLHQLGINVALGTDGAASNNDLDMISEMRTAALIGKISANDPKAAPAKNILQMATLNGAKALGMDHLIGSLTAGKAADFIAIDLGQLETQPLFHPISQIVYAASRHQVTDTWVMGVQLMKNRQLLTLDETEIRANATQWQTKLRAMQ